MRLLTALFAFIAISRGAFGAISDDDRAFLRSLDQRYRFGLEIELTAKELNNVISYYNVEGLPPNFAVAMMIDRPLKAVLRDDISPEVYNILRWFRAKPEVGMPDIEFYLDENTPTEIIRDPLQIIALQEGFARLARIEDKLAHPFRSYDGVSIHTHISRYNLFGDGERFEIERVLAQFDYKAAFIYQEKAEDEMVKRGLTIYVRSPLQRGQSNPVPLRDLVALPNYVLFEPRNIFDRTLITNFRGLEADKSRLLLADRNDVDIESVYPTHWIEDKGRFIAPTEQLIWTLKVLEGHISLEQIYNQIAEWSTTNDFILHIMQQLRSRQSRMGLAIGTLFRTARYAPTHRESLVHSASLALRATQHDPHHSDMIANFLLSAVKEEDRQFALAAFDDALKREPHFIRSLRLLAEPGLIVMIGPLRARHVLSLFTEEEQDTFLQTSECANLLRP